MSKTASFSPEPASASLASVLAGLSPDEEMATAQDNSLAWDPDCCVGVLADFPVIQKFLNAEPEELATLIEKWMALPECTDNLQQAIVRDYYIGVAWCARENKMTPQQASALVALMGILLDNCKTKNMPLEENVAVFQDLMRKSSSTDSVFVDPVEGMGENQQVKVWDFPTTVVQTITEFVTSSIFQHYRMFQQLFHGVREEEKSEVGLLITVPSDLAPLDEAMAQSEWDDHFNVPGEEGDASEGTGADAAAEEVASFETTLSAEQIAAITESCLAEATKAAPEDLRETLATTLKDIDYHIVPKIEHSAESESDAPAEQ